MVSCKTIRLQKIPQKLNSRWLPSLSDASPYDQGFARGYSEGWEKAQADGRTELEEKIKASRAHWDTIVQSLNTLPRDLIQKLKEQLVTLAFGVIRKILAATPITREEMAAQVGQMIEHVEAGAEIEIQLNPQDLELLTAEDRGALWNENISHLKWNPSPSVQRGGCVIHGDFGWMDGRRETRLNKLEQAAQNSIQPT